MAKRPHGDVERTKEGLDEEFYAGIAEMRLKAGMEMGRWGYRPQIILPLPLFLPPPSVPARVLPGTEALAAASYATVVHAVLDLVVNASSPAAGAASSSAPAMLDGTASGQDAAPVPDRGTASGQGAAPHPDRETASDRDRNPFASGQDAPANPDRDTASSQVAPAQDADMQDAPPQEADVQAAVRQTEEMVDRQGNYWRLDNAWDVWMWWDTNMHNWMWEDDDGCWYPNWQPARRRRNDGEWWSARGTWHESSSWGSMEK